MSSEHEIGAIVRPTLETVRRKQRSIPKPLRSKKTIVGWWTVWEFSPKDDGWRDLDKLLFTDVLYFMPTIPQTGTRTAKPTNPLSDGVSTRTDRTYFKRFELIPRFEGFVCAVRTAKRTNIYAVTRPVHVCVRHYDGKSWRRCATFWWPIINDGFITGRPRFVCLRPGPRCRWGRWRRWLNVRPTSGRPNERRLRPNNADEADEAITLPYRTPLPVVLQSVCRRPWHVSECVCIFCVDVQSESRTIRFRTQRKKTFQFSRARIELFPYSFFCTQFPKYICFVIQSFFNQIIINYWLNIKRYSIVGNSNAGFVVYIPKRYNFRVYSSKQFLIFFNIVQNPRSIVEFDQPFF